MSNLKVPALPSAFLANSLLFALSIGLAWVIYAEAIERTNMFVAQSFLAANGALALYLVFSSRCYQNYSAVTKALVIMILIPTLPHLFLNIIFGSRPLLVYPLDLRESQYAPAIEFASYAIPMLFINMVLLFSRHENAANLRIPNIPSSAAFYLYWFQCICFSGFSVLGQNVSLLGGDYAVVETGNFLSINSWNAMSTIALIFTASTRDIHSRLQQYMLGFAVLMSVFFASLLYGKRADVFGLFLVFIVLVSTRRVGAIKIAIFSGVAFAAFVLLTLIAILRDFGVSSTGLAESVHMSYSLWEQMFSDEYILPSLTDFFSTMPLVFSYTNYEGGDFYFGMTYLHALSSILPEFIFPFRIEDSATTFLQRNYLLFNGGMFLPAETYFNFGIVGVIFFAMCFAKICNRLQVITGSVADTAFIVKMHNAVVLAIIAGLSRYILYGTSNFTKHLILIAIIMFVTNSFIRVLPGRRYATTLVTGRRH